MEKYYVTPIELEDYYSPGLTLASWLTWGRNQETLDTLNYVCASGFERSEQLVDLSNIKLVEKFYYHQLETIEEMREYFVEAAIRLSEVPINSPITVDLHVLMNGISWGKQDIQDTLGIDERDRVSTAVLLGVSPWLSCEQR